MVKSPKSAGTQGLMQRPSRLGWIPRIYWEIFTKVQAAVPVSQLFFFAEGCRVAAGDHLGIAVRLGPVDFTDSLQISGTGLLYIFKRPAASFD